MSKIRRSESGAQLIARLGRKPDLHGIDPVLFTSSIPPGNIIELFGKGGCGKTEILLHWIANCILPVKWQGIELGGCNIDVLFIDNDWHFSILRLVNVIECCINHKIRNHLTNENSVSVDVESIIKFSLQHLYVERCHDSLEFLISLEMLETLLGNKPNIAVIMVDSISAFYWMDRNNFNETKVEHLMGVLQKVVNDYQIVAFLTNSWTNVNHKDVPQMEDAVDTPKFSNKFDPIYRVWQKLATQSYHMWKEKTGQTHGIRLYHPHTSNALCKLCISDSGVEYSK
ncbi:DNA repair protein XRCC2-like [Saccoglossus kowalevskii]|uniref:DNA repair protein XRCC2-like n=1 Tax=Saccoglossus kowalevskii TaxID=10224 RepID=A0ABM0GMF8_SACKO|nr:PREDICTED: DNA repair protein XRCC2-like [Saccoglossus kowalevskii]